MPAVWRDVTCDCLSGDVTWDNACSVMWCYLWFFDMWCYPRQCLQCNVMLPVIVWQVMLPDMMPAVWQMLFVIVGQVIIPEMMPAVWRDATCDCLTGDVTWGDVCNVTWCYLWFFVRWCYLRRFLQCDVMLSVWQVMLPETMPAQFQATYTPIAAAGTQLQIKHMARLLATQLVAAGLGKSEQQQPKQVAMSSPVSCQSVAWHVSRRLFIAFVVFDSVMGLVLCFEIHVIPPTLWVFGVNRLCWPWKISRLSKSKKWYFFADVLMSVVLKGTIFLASAGGGSKEDRIDGWFSVCWVFSSASMMSVEWQYDSLYCLSISRYIDWFVCKKAAVIISDEQISDRIFDSNLKYSQKWI